MFTTVDDERVKEGKATDAYFNRTEEALEQYGENPEVVAEVSADQFADDEYEVFAGLTDILELLEGLPIDVYSLEEGRLFDGGPVMRIHGNYLDLARYETALLGFLSQQSGFATGALKSKTAAGNVPVLSFGSRHLHPSLATALERSAFIGGVDGISNVAAAEDMYPAVDGPSGTMPHALMLSVGQANQEEIWKAFADTTDNVVILCDTFTDEVDEVIRAARHLGDQLGGVRLDTTGSRRGNFRNIIREVNWELDQIGRSDVDVFVSGGITPENITKLSDVVDGFGVGSYISNYDPIDFGVDIVWREGENTSKRGKLSGMKNVYRRNERHVVEPRENAGFTPDPDGILKEVIKDGNIVYNTDYDGYLEDARLRAQDDAVLLDLD